MDIKQKADSYVSENGTGLKRIMTADGKEKTDIDNVNVWLGLLTLFYEDQDGWVKLVSKSAVRYGADNVPYDDRADIIFNKIQDVASKYIPGGRDFSNYVIEGLALEYSSWKRKNKPVETALPIEDVDNKKDDKDNKNGTESKRGKKDKGGTKIPPGITSNRIKNEEWLDFLSQMVAVVKPLKRTKYTMYRIFYTNIFISVINLYTWIDMDSFRHKTTLQETLDHFMVGVFYKKNPITTEDYRCFDRITIKELSEYYNGNAFLNRQKTYGEIFSDALRSGKEFFEIIPFPIKPLAIYIAYLFIKESAENQNEEVEPHPKSYVVNYQKEFWSSMKEISAYCELIP